MTPVEHLKKIRRKIERTFWAKGALKRQSNGEHAYEYCILGLVEVTGDRPDKSYSHHRESVVVQRYPTVTRYLLEAVYDYVPYRSSNAHAANIAARNDGPNMTREGMIEWVERAIAIAEAEGKK